MAPSNNTLLMPVEVLLVEDNPTDLHLIKKALEHFRFPMDLGMAVDGQEAMDYLNRVGAFSHVLKPDLILLDLGLPKKSGWSVLGEIRRNPQFNAIPVVILTGSKDESDAKKARQMGADLYVVKPFDVRHYPVLVTSLEHLLGSRLLGKEPGNGG